MNSSITEAISARLRRLREDRLFGIPYHAPELNPVTTASRNAYSEESVPSVSIPSTSSSRSKAASNRIPRQVAEVTVMIREVLKGLETQQGLLNLPATTAASLEKALQALESSQRDYQIALGDRASVLYPAFHQADAEGKDFIGRATKVLRIQLGDRWNQAWSQAGFLSESTALPRTAAERESLIQILAGFFAADPTREAVNQGVTAARATELHHAIVDAKRNLQANKTRQEELKDSRDKALQDLRKLLRRTIFDLEIVLERDAPQWSSFGLVAPAKLDERTQAARKKAAKSGPAGATSSLSRTTEPVSPGTNGQEKVVALAQ